MLEQFQDVTSDWSIREFNIVSDPRRMTTISLGRISKFPSSVWISSTPCCSTIRKSPSEEENAVLLSIDFPAAKIKMPIPVFKVGSPEPATRCKPRTQSVLSSKSKGSHRSWFGMCVSLSKALRCSASPCMLSKLACEADGRILYSHDC